MSSIIHFYFKIDLFNHFSYVPESYPQFSLLPRPHYSNHILYSMHLDTPWFSSVPSLIFQCPLLPPSLLLTGTRLTTLHLDCQSGWGSFPSLKYLVAELMFLDRAKPFIEDNTWILTCVKCLQVLAWSESKPRPQELLSPEKYHIRRGSPEGWEAYRNAEVCKLLQDILWGLARAGAPIARLALCGV